MNIDSLTLQEIRDIYRQRMKHDFPSNELKPLSMIEKTLKKGCYLCYGLRDGADILAYAFFVLTEDIYMFDYFAVRKDLRGTGIGSGFLNELCGCHLGKATCVLVEVDDPAFAGSDEEKAVCERRLSFYLRNGLRDTGVRARTFGADFLILEFAGEEPHSRKEAEEAYSRIYRSVLPKAVFERMVKVI